MPSLDVIHRWRNFIRGCHPWMTFLHPWMTSKDGTFIHGWGFSIHGWDFHPSDFWWKLYPSYFQMRIPFQLPLGTVFSYTLQVFENCTVCCNSSEKLIVESSMAYVLGAGEMSSVDVIHGWRNVIHGWRDAIYGWRNVIRGCYPWMERCHPWMEKCHPWMEKCHPWMSSMDGEMSSMDGSVIRGCHPWMTSMDEDDGWRTWTQP